MEFPFYSLYRDCGNHIFDWKQSLRFNQVVTTTSGDSWFAIGTGQFDM